MAALRYMTLHVLHLLHVLNALHVLYALHVLHVLYVLHVLHVLHLLHVLHALHALHALHVLHLLHVLHALHVLHVLHVLHESVACIACIACIARRIRLLSHAAGVLELSHPAAIPGLPLPSPHSRAAGPPWQRPAKRAGTARRPGARVPYCPGRRPWPGQRGTGLRSWFSLGDRPSPAAPAGRRRSAASSVVRREGPGFSGRGIPWLRSGAREAGRYAYAGLGMGPAAAGRQGG